VVLLRYVYLIVYLLSSGVEWIVWKWFGGVFLCVFGCSFLPLVGSLSFRTVVCFLGFLKVMYYFVFCLLCLVHLVKVSP
jgi:hypothetical protein